MATDPSQLLYPLNLWADWLSAAVGARITSTYRTRFEQARLFRIRQRVLSGELPVSEQPYPVAPPGRSVHQFRRAWDMVTTPSRLQAAGRYWNQIGGRWSPRDNIHFEA